MKKVKEQELPTCEDCNKPVRWGNTGCPIVKKGNEMSVLFSVQAEYWLCYECLKKRDEKKELQSEKG